MRLTVAGLLLAAAASLHASDIQAVSPSGGVPPVGPYSPGVLTGDCLYVSGQGAKKPDGQMPATFDEQVRQTLENMKAVLEAAGTHHEKTSCTRRSTSTTWRISRT